jgi:hypothetical protein
MPRLRYYNANSTGGLPDYGSWVVRLTAPEDQPAVDELKFGDLVGQNVRDGQLARDVCNDINDQANKIRGKNRKLSRKLA